MKKLITRLSSILVSGFLACGLVLGVPASAWASEPHMTVLYLGTNNNDPNDGWTKNVNVGVGEYAAFYVEIHNTVVGTTAQNVKIKSTLPSGTVTSGSSTVTISADNANTVSDTVNFNITTAGGGQLQYVNGSTHMTWDPDGDGNNDYDGALLNDGIVGDGIILGSQKGCNEYIIQLSFLAKVEGAATPTPTPTPTPSPTPTPTPTPVCTTCGQSQDQNQSQNVNVDVNNTNNNNVNVTVPSPAPSAQVAGMKTLPETGAFAILFTALVGLIPLGFLLRKYRSLNLRLFTDESASKISRGENLSLSDVVLNRIGLKKDKRV